MISITEENNMSKHWIVVADQSKARIFTVDEPRGELQELEHLDHPAGRDQAKTLGSDRPGRSFDSSGQGRHAMGASVEPKEQEAIRFARQVGDHLRAACHAGHCNRLLLVAGPHFMGLLKDQLDSLTDVKVSRIVKNLGQYDPREIRSHLPERL
jgi:protein required for attachment to host cells